MRPLIVALVRGSSLGGDPPAGAATLAAIIPTVDRASACRLIYEKEAEFEGIGRASCRERVEISGGAGSLKKKTCTLGAFRTSKRAGKEGLAATPVFEGRFGV